MGSTAQAQRNLDDIGAYLPAGGRGFATVRQLLAQKSSPETFTIEAKSSVYEALCILAERRIGALVVVEGGRVVGIFSERDYARKTILIGKTSRETAVEEIMGAPAVTVGPETTVAECMALMTRRYLRHLPVLEGDRLVGLVSIGDVVKALLADQEGRLGAIEAYISGAYPA
jgi:CBS domain-containing protein